MAPRLAQFVAVATSQHISQAATKLGTGQPSLSRAMSRLETELGVALFARQGRRLTLTTAGAMLLEHAGPALDQLTAATGPLRHAHASGGQVRLGFVKTMADEVAPTMITAFHQSRPEVEFTLSEGANTELLGWLRSGEIDLALLAPSPEDSDITATVLDAQEMYLDVPPEHPLAEQESVRLADLAEQTFVAMRPEYGTRMIFDELCGKAGFRPRIAFQCDDTRAARGLVASGTGIALLPPPTHRHPGVASLRVSDFPTERQLCLAWTVRRPPGAAVSEFQHFLIAQRGRLLS